MLFKILYLLLVLYCMAASGIGLANLNRAKSLPYSSTSGKEYSDFVMIKGREKKCLFDAVPDDIIRYMFGKFLEPVSQIYFFQTCKHFHDVVMNHFRKDAFVYYNGKPILRVLKLFRIYKNPNLLQDVKTKMKDLLLTNSEVRAFSEYIFPLETNSLLSFFDNFNKLSLFEFIGNLRKTERRGSPALDTESYMMYLLCKKVDPEVVANLVLLYPDDMLTFLDLREQMKFFAYFWDSNRAKEITKLAFYYREIDIFKLLSAEDGSQWLYSLNRDQLNTLLDYSTIESEPSSKALRKLLSHCVRMKCNVRSLFKLIPPHSVSMRIDLFHALLLLNFSVVEIMGICEDKFKLYLSLTVPEGLVPLLLRAGVRCEDLVREILTGINGYAIQPIWNQDHYQLAKVLGYYEGFLATMKLKMRHQY